MGYIKKISILLFTVSFFSIIFIASTAADLDPKYIDKFGYGTICVSGKDYPKIDSYDESNFDYRDGKFYIKQKGSLHLRAILPEGKTYKDLLSEFTSKDPEYNDDNALEKMVWRIFASHDKDGNKIGYSTWPPSGTEMEKQVRYVTNPKELAYISYELQPNMEAMNWKSSGIPYNTSNDLITLVEGWMQIAKPGWQLYIVHTVGYRTAHTGDNYFVSGEPIMTALVEIK